MPELRSPLVLAGPTTVGKSDVARELADRTQGVILNADKYYLYANRLFQIGLGLVPGELNDGRQRELYGVLSPETPLPSTEDFLSMTDAAVKRAHHMGQLAIIEGCSYRHNMALIHRYGAERSVSLTWADRDGVSARVDSRMRKLIALGLYEETQRALDAGYEHTYPMTSMMYRPAIQVVRGVITKDEATTRIAENGMGNAMEHDELYASHTGLARFVHSRGHESRTANLILNHIAK